MFLTRWPYVRDFMTLTVLYNCTHADIINLFLYLLRILAEVNKNR
jgi:FtsH-binding integral membrane protein